MFLVPSDKRHILDLTLWSPTTISTSPSSSSSSSSSPSNKQQQETQQPQAKKQNILKGTERIVLAFLIRTSNIIKTNLIDTLTNLTRWLKLKIGALFLRPNLARISGSSSSLSSLPSSLADTTLNQLAWQERPTTNSGLQLMSDSNLVAQDLNEILAASLAAAINNENYDYKSNNRNYNDHNNNTNENTFICQMDPCRCRAAQRAAAPQSGHVVGSTTSSCSFWHYSPTPLSLQSSSSHQEVGLEALEASQRQQTLVELIQGQRKQHDEQSSFGLQALELPAKPHYLHQQQQKQRSQQHDMQTPPKSLKYNTCATQQSPSSIATNLMNACKQQQREEEDRQVHCDAMNFNADLRQQEQDHQQRQQQRERRDERRGRERVGGAQAEVGHTPQMVLVSKAALSDLTDKMDFSMRKMKDLEEQVKVIPELQRRLDYVISDNSARSSSSSVKDFVFNQNQNNNQQQRLTRYTENANSMENIGYYNGASNGRHQSGSAANADILRGGFAGIHPSLQRHYNSFKSSVNKPGASRCLTSDAISVDNHTSKSNSLNTRSSLFAGSIAGDHNRLDNCNRNRQSFINNTSNSSNNVPLSNNSNSSRNNNNTNLFRSSQESPINGSGAAGAVSNRATSTPINTNAPRVEYEDLINDLISLSYSVNYMSSNSNSVANSVTTLSTSNNNHSINRSPMKDMHATATQATTTMTRPELGCGCQSIKEHLRYNSISREQRLNSAKSQQHQSVSATNSNVVSPQPTPTATQKIPSRIDASTNTELSMGDIVTKDELNSLMTNMQRAYSTLSSTRREKNQLSGLIHKSSSLPSESASSSGSISELKSSLNPDSRSDSREGVMKSSDSSSIKGIVDENEEPRCRMSEGDNEEEEEEEEEEGTNGCGSLNGEEPYSLGSSYQDPSDFEEYCAYGESLDRRTKDFMSQTSKISNDLRFALIRLNDFIKRRRSIDQIESTSGCLDVIKKEWFEVAASKDSQATRTKLYVNYFESFTKQLLNTVVNLVDSAGNSAMHYAASYYKMDIIKVLLSTKVCDVNCRNRAGYTPMMLLALADIEGQEDQEIARHLFSMGDVNIKARSSGQTALMLAASHGRLSTCKLLLECSADPSLQDFDGSTALMCGSELGNEEVVRCLLAHRLTDLTATDNDGLDALTIAMNNGHKNIGLILYAAKNVPRMVRSALSQSGSGGNNFSTYSSGSYLGASLRRSRGKLASNFVRRADSLLSSRSVRESAARQHSTEA